MMAIKAAWLLNVNRHDPTLMLLDSLPVLDSVKIAVLSGEK
jgi:hypothetical protein